MKHALITFSAIIACLIMAPAAFSNSPDAIRQAMIAGDFVSAFEQAEQLETANGYALAAESLLSEIMIGQAKKNKKQAKQARKLAEAGLEIDPMHQNARLQYAIADGFVARETGDVSAWMKKLPQKTHAIITAYRSDFPADPRGDALLGAWHLAVARKAGGKNAEKWFDATIEEGREFFQKARITQPNDVVINVNYAFSLMALKSDDFDYIEDVRQILSEVVEATPDDHIGRLLQSYAVEALANIEDQDKLRDYVCLFLDGKVPAFS